MEPDAVVDHLGQVLGRHVQHRGQPGKAEVRVEVRLPVGHQLQQLDLQQPGLRRGEGGEAIAGVAAAAPDRPAGKEQDDACRQRRSQAERPGLPEPGAHPEGQGRRAQEAAARAGQQEPVAPRRQPFVVGGAAPPGLPPLLVAALQSVSQPKVAPRDQVGGPEADLDPAAATRQDRFAGGGDPPVVGPQPLDDDRRGRRPGQRPLRIDRRRAAHGGEPDGAVEVPPGRRLEAAAAYRARQAVALVQAQRLQGAGLPPVAAVEGGQGDGPDAAVAAHPEPAAGFDQRVDGAGRQPFGPAVGPETVAAQPGHAALAAAPQGAVAGEKQGEDAAPRQAVAGAEAAPRAVGQAVQPVTEGGHPERAVPAPGQRRHRGPVEPRRGGQRHRRVSRHPEGAAAGCAGQQPALGIGQQRCHRQALQARHRTEPGGSQPPQAGLGADPQVSANGQQRVGGGRGQRAQADRPLADPVTQAHHAGAIGAKPDRSRVVLADGQQLPVRQPLAVTPGAHRSAAQAHQAAGGGAQPDGTLVVATHGHDRVVGQPVVAGPGAEAAVA